jgi:hypothetical protein
MAITESEHPTPAMRAPTQRRSPNICCFQHGCLCLATNTDHPILRASVQLVAAEPGRRRGSRSPRPAGRQMTSAAVLCFSWRRRCGFRGRPEGRRCRTRVIPPGRIGSATTSRHCRSYQAATTVVPGRGGRGIPPGRTRRRGVRAGRRSLRRGRAARRDRGPGPRIPGSAGRLAPMADKHADTPNQRRGINGCTT